MPRYIALLRGINVGGNTMIKMAELKTTFESLGLDNVVTYINSGNIAFDTRKTDAAKLALKIGAAIEKDFDKQIAVMVRTQAAIAEILIRNPFAGEFDSHKEMHVLFMSEPMPDDKRDLLMDKQTADERFAVEGLEIYCHLRLGVADSLLGKGFIDKKLKIPTTGRNWRTVEKLSTL